MRRHVQICLTLLLSLIHLLWNGETISACVITQLEVTSPNCTLSGYEGSVPVYRCQPGADITYDVTNITGTASSYEWRVNGVTITGATGSSLSYTLEKTGKHTVKAILHCPQNQLHSARVFATVPFTVTAIPAAGGSIQAANGLDDGLDCAEGDAGSTKCTESYEQNAESLKVVPDADFVPGGITVNGVPAGMDDFINMVTASSGALVTLEPQFDPRLELQRVNFFGADSIEVAQDDGTPYPRPQWERTNPSPSPVAYVRNGKMKADVTLQTDKAIADNTIYIKGDGPGNLDFGPVQRTLSEGSVTASVPFSELPPPWKEIRLPDQVEFFKNFRITWSYAYAENGPWFEAGTSETLLYGTFNTPETSSDVYPTTRPVYHSLLHLGCANSQGASSASETLDGIWQAFETLHVPRVMPSGEERDAMTYYAKRDNLNVQFTAELLQKGDGPCDAWARLFIDTLKIQGLKYGPHLVELRYQPSRWRNWWIFVKKWDFQYQSGSDPHYPYENEKDNPWIVEHPGEIPDFSLQWKRAGVVDLDGIAGQGEEMKNPYSIFKYHMVVSLAGAYYDPSYGKVYPGLEKMDPVIAGYGYLKDPGGSSNPTFYLQQNFDDFDFPFKHEASTY